MYKDLKPWALAGFEPGIFISVRGCDDHNAAPAEIYIYFLFLISLKLTL
jgi:hypothetical protein